MNKPVAFHWSARATRPDVRIVPVQSGKTLAPASLPAVDRHAIEAWCRAAEFAGAVGATAWPTNLPAPVLLVGIGRKEEFHAARWRRAWAAAGRALAQAAAVRRAAFEWPAAATFPLETAALAGLAADGLLAGAYAFEAYKTKKSARAWTFEWVGAALAAEPARAAVRRAETAGAVLRDVRELANRPANELGPAELAAESRKLARAAGVSCRVWDAAALAKEKCGALLAVARGSRRPGCLIRLAHAGQRGQKPLVVVGKAVTFDSGGISLKPGKNMEWMKYDKSGGMAALATVLLAARLKLPRPVVAYIPAVENMPGGGATRPGDIVTARIGKTIEILNTDAEGRLILADALSFAADEKPAAIVDVATLTGAVIVALGHEATAVLGNDDRLVLDLMLSGEATGERLWQLPLWPEYDEMLKGQFADLKNVGDGSAGTIAGGAFLKAFVPAGVPWAHLDVAGTAWLEKDEACGAAGATLVPARLLADWAARTTLDS
ncbi:MAG: leucyl aminopeptidase [Spartobacteria bacterium]|nr:leucyl aminopeptidase [Spartobacteria bacterium]